MEATMEETKLLTFEDNKDSRFNDLYFICQAVEKGFAWRPVLQYISVENDRVVATNGHILHMVKKNEYGLSPGLYKIHKALKKKIVLEKVDTNEKYPDYRITIPTINDKSYKNITLSGIVDMAYAKAIRAITEDAGINYEYFKCMYKHLQLRESKDLPITLYYDPDTLHKSMLMSCGDYDAILMPFRMLDN